jgi:hypothetical protein
MFPTMSLGPPANLTSSEHQASTSASASASSAASSQFNNLPPANNVTSVLTAIRNSTSPNETTRRPSEQLLQSWGDYYTVTSSSNGYLGSLLHIINGGVAPNNTAAAAAAVVDGSIVEDSSKLMAAILLKNNVPKLFSISTDDSNNTNNSNNTTAVTEAVNNEKMFIRQSLFQLLFQAASHSLNPTLVLHLQLAISNIALFDFPLGWSTLLDDLMSVVSTTDIIAAGGVSTAGGGMIRVRAIKTLRMCLSSIRHRKLIVKDRTTRNNNKRGGLGGGSRPNPIMDMRNLEAMIGKAVHERKEVHMKACAIFDGLAEGIVRHAQLAMTGGSSSVGNGDAHTSWQIECMLATSHIKCMTELFPMLEIEQVHTDPRVPAVSFKD